MTIEYRQGPHTTFKIEYHLVWVTKYRKKLLKDSVGQRVRELIRQTCEMLNVEIKRGVVSLDHIHILVSAPPDIAPSELARRLKGRSATKLFEEFPHIKKELWGRHFWARGYFCVTVGELNEDNIKEYLEHHFEKENTEGFRVEG